MIRAYPDLKTWRTAHRLDQRAAAAELGISQTKYSRLERQVMFAKGQSAKRIIEHTGVPLEVVTGVAS